MSHFFTSERLKWGLIFGSPIVLAAAWKCYRKSCSNQDKIPTTWKKVGQITDLLCFPIKSGGWIRLDEFDCDKIGVGLGKMRDRTFMVVDDETGVFVTGRKYPKLVQIKPSIEGDVMTLTAPGMSEIQVEYDKLLNSDLKVAEVWDEKVKVHDAGDAVAQWVSKFILDKDSGLRLVYFPSKIPTRDVREKNKVFETAISSDTGGLHDATAYNLINEASIEELNSRLENPVTPLWFRPNIVIKGPAAFEEDNWNYVKFGDHGTVFKNVKPCTRCIFTTVDPETAQRNAKEEPLKTLRSYRKQPKCGENPVMGIHLGIREGSGKIKVGDFVYIGM